jgi:DNA-binding LytR/AlgR family response regulator
MTPLRILTVDDEMLALRRLRLLLQTLPYVEHVGEADGCSDALVKAGSLAPDVVLLDIRMRDGSGFDVVEALARRPAPPVVIFVSAFDRFAMRAFEASVCDYLLKPVERDRLAQALMRARDRRSAADAEARVGELQEIVRNLRAAAPARSAADGEPEAAAPAEPPYESEFWLRNGTGFIRVVADMIDWISSEDEYVAFHAGQQSWLMRGSIRQLQARLDPDRFVRIHRKLLVRKGAIAELRTPRIGRLEVVLRGGQRLPAGRVYARALREMVAQPAPAQAVGA